MAADADAARRRWELENGVAAADPETAALYAWDADEQRALQAERPWARDPRYFKRVRVSALALLKMATHARAGGDIEVMGVMQGKVVGDAFIVLDAFALPVEGTETRVNAAAEGYEYMVAFQETCKAAGRPENVVGWYHSHPGYGCWLSGIDVQTQLTNQRYQEPFLAIVVDPHRTVAAGRVELGAFRTLPEGAPGAAGSADPAGEYQTIPLDKVEDFGVHANAYYPLEVSYFKSALDGKLLEALWGRYWAATLAGNPLAATAALAAGQLADVARKLEAVAEAGGGGLGSGAGGALGGALAAGGGGGGGRFAAAGARRDPSRLEQAAKDGARAAAEQAKGLATQLVKEMLFCAPAEAAGKAAAEAPMDI